MSALPDVVDRFAEQEKGLIIFSGEDPAAVSSAASALAGHVWETTGRAAAVVVTAGRDAGELGDLPFTVRTATARSGQSEQLRSADAEGDGIILVDCGPDSDTLIQAVEAAAGGALVITTLSLGGVSYPRVLDLLQSAEDWDIRTRFDTALYALVQIQTGDSARDPDVFILG